MSLRPVRLFLFLALAALAPGALAATLTVTSTADSGPGSLRAQISTAAPGDAITFAPSVMGTIPLTSGMLPTITNDLTIRGRARRP